MLAGLVVSVAQLKITSRGKMAFVQLDDGSSSLEVSVFNETFEQGARKDSCEDEVLIIEGKVQRDDFAGEGQGKCGCAERLRRRPARGRFARQLRISLNGQASGANARTAAQRLQALLAPYTPETARYAFYRNADAA